MYTSILIGMEASTIVGCSYMERNGPIPHPGTGCTDVSQPPLRQVPVHVFLFYCECLACGIFFSGDVVLGIDGSSSPVREPHASSAGDGVIFSESIFLGWTRWTSI